MWSLDFLICPINFDHYISNTMASHVLRFLKGHQLDRLIETYCDRISPKNSTYKTTKST
jgi:hypothetical protein